MVVIHLLPSANEFNRGVWGCGEWDEEWDHVLIFNVVLEEGTKTRVVLITTEKHRSQREIYRERNYISSYS
jgi:hypothetical protein